MKSDDEKESDIRMTDVLSILIKLALLTWFMIKLIIK